MKLYNGYGKKIEIGSDFFDKTYPAYSNLFDPADYTDDVKLNAGTGDTVALAGSTTSGYVDITGCKYIYPEYAIIESVNPKKVYTTYPYYTYVCFYDENKNFVSGDSTYAGATYTTARPPLEVPDGAKYCRCSWKISYGGVRTCEMWQFGVFGADDNSAGSIPFEPYYASGALESAYIKPENHSYTAEPLHKGKTWALFGDSLTDAYGGHDWQESTSPNGGDGWKDTTEKVPWTGYFWASKIAREFGLVLDNRAKSGSNINVGSNGNYADVCGINILDAFLSEIDAGAEAPDYITVHFGSNAIMSQLGTSEDTSETTSTVCGAVKYFIEQLREKCPNSVIGFVLPPQSDWGDTSTIKSVEQGREAIKSVLDLDEYSVPYVDLWKESGITVDMLPDGIHISSKQANNLYYHAMRRFMMGL